MPAKYLEMAARAFQFAAEPVCLKPFSAGHINNTFLVDCGEGTPKYILQRVNTAVFQKPLELMSNIKGVSRHIARKAVLSGKEPGRMARTIIQTKTGEDYFVDPDGNYWRAFLEIENVFSCDQPDSPELFYKSAVAFGRFVKQLADYPVHTLYETIPDFHDTVGRMRDLKRAVREDRAGRAEKMRGEIGFVLSRQEDCSYIVDRIADGRLPIYVTHNDAKLSNILMDKETGEGVCIIDLDTVMPGSLLYDFGEAIRFGASLAREDETDLEKVRLDLTLFREFVRGFVGELWDVIAEEEALEFPMGAYLMALETGIRFLTDYLNGDTYYQIDYPEQNRDRARNQLRLAADIQSKLDHLTAVIKDVYDENKKRARPL